VLEYETEERNLKMKTINTPIAFKVVTLSSIPERKHTPTSKNTSRYNDAIVAAAKYTKRAILLNTPDIKTRKQAMTARYSVLSAIRARKLEKTLCVVQRDHKLFLRKVTKTAKTTTPTNKVA
jgi:hypothetical protein